MHLQKSHPVQLALKLQGRTAVWETLTALFCVWRHAKKVKQAEEGLKEKTKTPPNQYAIFVFN